MFRHQFITLMSTIVLVGLTGYLYVTIPKGFFPEQDTGFIFGQAEARQDISFASARTNGSVFFGLDTILGPVYIALGLNDDGSSAYYLFLGRTF